MDKVDRDFAEKVDKKVDKKVEKKVDKVDRDFGLIRSRKMDKVEKKVDKGD